MSRVAAVSSPSAACADKDDEVDSNVDAAMAAKEPVAGVDMVNANGDKSPIRAVLEPTDKETKEQEPLETIKPSVSELAASDQQAGAGSSKDHLRLETNEEALQVAPGPPGERLLDAPPTPVTPDTPKHLASSQDDVAVSSNMETSPNDTSKETTTTPQSSPPETSSSSTPPNSSDKGLEVLDRGQDVSDLESNHPNEQSPPTVQQKHKSQREDDVDSSDDESSYFAKHLPSPKSRRYSFSSNASAPADPTAMMRETDASLSLSDDSDDGVHHHHSDSGPFPKHHLSREAVADLQVYNQRITRMHSVSSLVSTSSHNSVGSADELPGVMRGYPPTGGLSPPKSGRLSPVMGEHAPSRGRMFFSSPSSFNPGPSPPTILPVHPPVGMPHPQPHVLSQEQWAGWMASGNAAAMDAYGAAGYDPGREASLQSSNSAWSASNEESLGYSDDGVEVLQPNNPFLPSQEQSFQQQSSNSKKKEKKKMTRDEGRIDSDKGFRAQNDKTGAVGRINKGGGGGGQEHHEKKGFKVYWQRWIMLGYMSVLNLLSDWTCYSVAPIALLTEQAFGNINPEQLVVVFLGANAIASACEPIILSRLGLRRTVVFGALLLMLGSIIKSGGMPPIIQADLEKGKGEWRVYLGFFFVGLSQPLYQCTPALLSASWFPERERTMATGVALNANQLGIGFAFIFGTLLVSTSDDIPSYFGLLSIISTVTFLGALTQFEDAPPTPPSDTARVMRGTLEANLPSIHDVFQSIRGLGSIRSIDPDPGEDQPPSSGRSSATPSQRESKGKSSKRISGGGSSRRESSGTRRSDRSSARKGQRSAGATSSSTKQSSGSSGTARRRNPRSQTAPSSSGSDAGFHGLAPSPASGLDPVSRQKGDEGDNHAIQTPYPAPSPMMSGGIDPDTVVASEPEEKVEEAPGGVAPYPFGPPPPGNVPPPVGQIPYPPPGPFGPMPYQPPGGVPPPPFGQMPYPPEGGMPYNAPYPGYPPYPFPYWDPRFQQFAYYQQQQLQQQEGSYDQPPMDPYLYSYQNSQLPPYPYTHESLQAVLPSAGAIDQGAEPVLTMTDNHLDIDIEDDQVLRSIRACMSRPGFVHALVAFTVSGIVINTLSTFMDYLVRLNGAGREYTGIVGGSFQFVIMISSLIIGKVCDKTRAYYSITVGMLVLGAFGLAECGVDLDADRGTELRWSLVIVAALVGPLQPVSTELGVDVVYPLSENTVLVIQQLFSNLLSALFIPCFKAMKDVGVGEVVDGVERPEYTFSFYLLIVLHATATVFFATFNGRYLRFEHEVEKKEQEEQRKMEAKAAAFHPVLGDRRYMEYDDRLNTEQQPLLNTVV